MQVIRVRPHTIAVRLFLLGFAPMSMAVVLTAIGCYWALEPSTLEQVRLSGLPIAVARASNVPPDPLLMSAAASWRHPGALQAGLLAIIVVLATCAGAVIAFYAASLIQTPLKRLQAALGTLRASDLSLHTRGVDELEALHDLVQALHRRAPRDLATFEALGPAESALVAAHQHVRKVDVTLEAVARDIIASVEMERRAIADELHDHIDTHLVPIRLRAHALTSLDSRRDTLAATSVLADSILASTNCLFGVLRTTIKRLRPELLETSGLEAALDELVASFAHDVADLELSLHVADDWPGLRGLPALMAYRIVEDAVLSCMGRSPLPRLKIELNCTVDVLEVCISDDGSGTGLGGLSTELVLLSMRARAHLIDGTLNCLFDCRGGNRLELRLGR